jgi:hypothetical protein
VTIKTTNVAKELRGAVSDDKAALKSESTPSITSRRVFLAASATMDWPFRITEYHGLSLAITPTADCRASLLMSKLLRDRIMILEALLETAPLRFGVRSRLSLTQSDIALRYRRQLGEV